MEDSGGIFDGLVWAARVMEREAAEDALDVRDVSDRMRVDMVRADGAE